MRSQPASLPGVRVFRHPLLAEYQQLVPIHSPTSGTVHNSSAAITWPLDSIQTPFRMGPAHQLVGQLVLHHRKVVSAESSCVPAASCPTPPPDGDQRQSSDLAVKNALITLTKKVRCLVQRHQRSRGNTRPDDPATATSSLWATGITNQPIRSPPPKWKRYAAKFKGIGTDVPADRLRLLPASRAAEFPRGDNLDSIYSSGPYAVEAAGRNSLPLDGYDRTVSLQIDIWNENEIKFGADCVSIEEK